MNKKRKKLISIDLDGVLNVYNGNYKKDKLSPMKNGAYEFLESLAEKYEIEIYTVRDKELCEKWLEENNLAKFVRKVGNTKNRYTSVFIDDRAVTFSGDYFETLKKIETFEPYWKKL